MHLLYAYANANANARTDIVLIMAVWRPIMALVWQILVLAYNID